MARQKAVQKEEEGEKKEEEEEPKPKGKRSRRKAVIDGIREKGRQIAEGGNVKTKSSIKWKVRSQTVQCLLYVVALSTLGLVCTCKANADGKQMCKHVVAVHRIIEKEWWSEQVRKRIRIERPVGKCRTQNCPAEKIWKNGERPCTRKKDVQRYICKSCRKSIHAEKGFAGRHFDPEVIVRVLSMLATKMSPAEAARQLKLENIRIHPATIARWSEHYSHIMAIYALSLRIDAGFQWHVDELHIKIRGQARYLFGVMDGASRFILSYEMSIKKKGANPTRLFMTAAARALRPPRILVSDGLPEFCKPAKKAFYRMAGPRFTHVQEIHIRNLFNHNNVYERFNCELRARLQCARGLNSENPAIISLMITYHNFFRGHTALEGGITPAEAIGIDIAPVQDSELSPECDRWITFIQKAAAHTAT